MDDIYRDPEPAQLHVNVTRGVLNQYKHEAMRGRVSLSEWVKAACAEKAHRDKEKK